MPWPWNLGWGHSRSLKMAPFDRPYTTSWSSIKQSSILYHFRVIWRWITSWPLKSWLEVTQSDVKWLHTLLTKLTSDSACVTNRRTDGRNHTTWWHRVGVYVLLDDNCYCHHRQDWLFLHDNDDWRLLLYVIENGTIRKLGYGFQFAFRSNYGTVLYHFLDKARSVCPSLRLFVPHIAVTRQLR